MYFMLSGLVADAHWIAIEQSWPGPRPRLWAMGAGAHREHMVTS